MSYRFDSLESLLGLASPFLQGQSWAHPASTDGSPGGTPILQPYHVPRHSHTSFQLSLTIAQRARKHSEIKKTSSESLNNLLKFIHSSNEISWDLNSDLMSQRLFPVHSRTSLKPRSKAVSLSPHQPQIPPLFLVDSCQMCALGDGDEIGECGCVRKNSSSYEQMVCSAHFYILTLPLTHIFPYWTWNNTWQCS